jgi:DNA-binding CsgD family transcriptional regulator
LFREIASDSGEPLLLEIVGVGGSGKSVLLDVLERRWTESGVPVTRDPSELTGAALIVDDAHLLTEHTLHSLSDSVRAGRISRLLVARRPYPRFPALAELGALLAARRAPLVLGDLDRSGVAGRAALALGARPSVELVETVLAHTGGSPALVTALLDALAATGGLESVGRGDRAPGGLLEQLGYQLDRLPEALRRLTLALAAGAPLDAEVLAPLLELGVIEVTDLVEQAGATGLLTLSERPALRPLWARAVLAATPRVRLLAQRRRLAEVQLERGSSVLACAVDLLGSDATGAQVAVVYRSAAEELLRKGTRATSADGSSAEVFDSDAGPIELGNPAVLAGRLLDAAVKAGAPSLELAARRAEAAARAGDLDRALELADQVLADHTSVSEQDRALAVTVAAAALAQRGLLARSAELYRWLGAASMGANAVVAVPALLGTGALAEARELLEPSGGPGAGRPPTLLAGAESLLARGVYDTVAGSPTAALSQLARAAALLEPRAGTVLLPDTPAALAALVAAHCGELDVASSVLERAVATGLGGVGAAARHRLLQGWVLMSRGATGAAKALLAEVDADAAAVGTGRLEPRDELVAAALEVGLGRRAGDLAALMPAWARAREAIVRHPVDLYVLQPLSELIVAAARLREQSWVRPHLDEAHALLARLGEPILWSASVHWAELHAALIAEQWDEASSHVAALQKAAPSGRFVGALAVAAPQWLAVLRDGAVDAGAVEVAARGLHAVGLSWEGGKLAGQGAIRTTDRKAMSALLQCARGLQSTGHTAAAAPSDSPEAGGRGSGQGTGRGPDGTAHRAEGAAYRPDGGAYPSDGAGDRAGGYGADRSGAHGDRPGGYRPDGSGRVQPAAGQVSAGPGQRPAGVGQRPAGTGQRPAGTGQRPAAPERHAAADSGRSRSDGGGAPGQQGTLSDRELEVAELVVAGLTYKEIGERLFISAKTVEHHVARMRQRLGSTSRGELMAHLRMITNN